VGLDDLGAATQRVVHHGADRFGVEVLAQRGGADDVVEQDADLLELLLGFGRRRGHQRGERSPHGAEPGIDNSVAQHGALGLQCGDRAFELLLLCRHRPTG